MTSNQKVALLIGIPVVVVIAGFLAIGGLSPRSRGSGRDIAARRYQKERTQRLNSNALRFDVVSIEDRAIFVHVKVKITNVSSKHINSANVTCVLLDRAGKEITFETHYAVKSLEGGLDPGEMTYFTYVIEADHSRVASVQFKVKSID